MPRDDDTPRSSQQLSRRNVGALWVPIGSAVIAIGVMIGAAATWATDRAELHASTTNNTKQDVRLDDQQRQLQQLQRDRDVDAARSDELRKQIERMQQTLDRVAERVGAKQ